MPIRTASTLLKYQKEEEKNEREKKQTYAQTNIIKKMGYNIITLKQRQIHTWKYYC